MQYEHNNNIFILQKQLDAIEIYHKSVKNRQKNKPTIKINKHKKKCIF